MGTWEGTFRDSPREVPREPSTVASSLLTRSKLPDLAVLNPQETQGVKYFQRNWFGLYEPRRAGEKGAPGGKLEAMPRGAPGWPRKQNPCGFRQAYQDTTAQYPVVPSQLLEPHTLLLVTLMA